MPRLTALLTLLIALPSTLEASPISSPRQLTFEGLRAGGLDYIVKPYLPEEMLMRVRTHLERVLLARALGEERVRNRDLERARDELARQLRGEGRGPG